MEKKIKIVALYGNINTLGEKSAGRLQTISEAAVTVLPLQSEALTSNFVTHPSRPKFSSKVGHDLVARCLSSSTYSLPSSGHGTIAWQPVSSVCETLLFWQ